MFDQQLTQKTEFDSAANKEEALKWHLPSGKQRPEYETHRSIRSAVRKKPSQLASAKGHSRLGDTQGQPPQPRWVRGGVFAPKLAESARSEWAPASRMSEATESAV